MSNIVIKPKTATYSLNKSKFLGFVYPVQSLAEIQMYLKEIKSKYRDARHFVYAYRLDAITMNCDEDGEPSNTCGKPMLSFLIQQDYIQTLIIVVRYFGGVLLGTGNLKHAYLTPMFECLENNTTTYIPLYQYQATFSYEDLGYFNNWIQKTDGVVTNLVYLEQGVVCDFTSQLTQNEISLPHSIKINIQ